jgi:hypothetical protein
MNSNLELTRKNRLALTILVGLVFCTGGIAMLAQTVVRGPAANKGTPVFRINKINDPTLHREVGTILSPIDWKFQSNVQWDQQNRMFQPCLINLRIQGPNGEFVQYLPSWTPNPMSQVDMQNSRVTSEDEVVQKIAQVSGLQAAQKQFSASVGQLQLVPGMTGTDGVTIGVYAFVLNGTMQGQNVQVLSKVTISTAQGLPFQVVCEILPIVVSSGNKRFDQEQAQLYALASSLRMDTGWLLAYMKIVYPTGQWTAEAIANSQKVYDRCSEAWDKTIRGVSTYPINGRDYDLPYSKVYSYDDTYIYRADNVGLLPANTTVAEPRAL